MCDEAGARGSLFVAGAKYVVQNSIGRFVTEERER